MVRRKLSKGINLSEIELRKENENRQKVSYLSHESKGYTVNLLLGRETKFVGWVGDFSYSMYYPTMP